MPARRVDVKALREEMGLTRRQLARKVPISLRSIERHESPTNTRDMTAAASAHLDRLLSEHRKALQSTKRPAKSGAAGKANAAPSPKPSAEPPRRRPLDTPVSHGSPVGNVRPFGRPSGDPAA